ncbi:MAG: Chromosome partition protein Smc [Planctomycetes bacterium ADurb.Bin126]|nr:MAG: Chromosome partition protein Smc [Planctomycetes bacterium ADurb.Bin126]HOD80851.1 hypothetical protein [Phycisphaerae bacterium]HQL74825.1 hypothetical protein [Phycisphaerae bacterium]
MADSYTNRTLREIVRVVAARFVGMALIVFTVVAAVALATWQAPRTYRSQVRLLAKPSGMGNPLESDISSLREQVSLFVATQREIILSDYVLASALLTLEGKEMPKAGNLDPKALADWDRLVRQYIVGDDAAGEDGHAAYLARVARRVEMVTPGGPDSTFSQTLIIRVDWPEESTPSAKAAIERTGLSSRELAARRAHDMAAALVNAYTARYTRLESERSKAASAFLTNQALHAARAGLDQAAEDLEKFIAIVKGDLLSIINLTTRYAAGTETGVASLSTKFQAERDKIEERLAEVQALMKVVQTELAKPPADIAVPDAVAAQNQSVTALEAKIVSLKLQINQLESRFTSEYRELVDSKTEMQAAQKELAREMRRQEERLTQELAVLTARRNNLDKTVQDYRSRADALATKAAQYERLREALASAQSIYEAEQKRVVSAATAEKLAAMPVLVSELDAPSLPEAKNPRKPVMWINMLVAVVAAVVMALVYAFLADHFDHSLKSIDNAERYLGVPVLASVPKIGGPVIRLQGS